MKNVLILSAGRRVSLVEAFLSEVKELGLSSTQIIAADATPKYSAACYFANDFAVLPRVSDPLYLENLHRLCLEKEIGVVIPTIDTELIPLSVARNLFERDGINLVVSNEDLVRRCRDKTKTSDLFGELGVRTPLLYPNDAHPYPVFVKPRDGSSSKGLFFARQRSELPESLRTDPNSIFCEYISPDRHFEITVDAYFSRSGTICGFVPRLRLETRGGEVSKSKTIDGAFVSTLEASLKLLKGARGCITLQFFVEKDTDELIGIELNPRFGGGFPLSYFAGANFPRAILSEYLLLQEPGTWFDWKRNLCMLRFDKEVLFDA
jgi:carbamoyl-phosphate synthase large subunit